MSGTAHVWPLAASSKLQVIHSLWLFVPCLAAHWIGQAALKSWFLPALGPGLGQPMSQGIVGSASGVRLRIVTDSTVSERASGGIGGWDSWISMGGAFQTPIGHYFTELGRVEPLVG